MPDILVAADGRAFAVRGADGRLAFHHTGSDTFATREWLAADADGRDAGDKGLGDGIVCDPTGCIGKLDDGRLVSYVLAPDAFEEDCRRAAVIVTTRDAPPDCEATVIGRKHVARAWGAGALPRRLRLYHSSPRGRRILTGHGRREQRRAATRRKCRRGYQ